MQPRAEMAAARYEIVLKSYFNMEPRLNLIYNAHKSKSRFECN